LGVIFGYAARGVFASSEVVGIILAAISLVMIVWGSYLWVKMKNRSKWFILFGVLAPIGYIGLMLLKDKSLNVISNVQNVDV
jgi:hypothetical protein